MAGEMRLFVVLREICMLKGGGGLNKGRGEGGGGMETEEG
jgi:hypothetical protein